MLSKGALNYFNSVTFSVTPNVAFVNVYVGSLKLYLLRVCVYSD